MKTEIRDAQAVRAIRPFDAALYLRANHWNQVEQLLPNASLWTLNQSGDEYEAFLPMSPEAGDASEYFSMTARGRESRLES